MDSAIESLHIGTLIFTEDNTIFEEYLPANVKESMDWSIKHQAPGDFVQKALRNRTIKIYIEKGVKSIFALSRAKSLIIPRYSFLNRGSSYRSPCLR